MQQYADIYLLLNYSTCFGRPSRPSSAIHKTVVALSGTDDTIWEASLLASQIVWSWRPDRISLEKEPRYPFDTRLAGK